MKTQKEIAAEIKALEACKTYIPKMTAFGDNNHHNLDLQIEELRDGIDRRNRRRLGQLLARGAKRHTRSA